MAYTAEQFRHEAPPRIMGSETEYTSNAVQYGVEFAKHVTAPHVYVGTYRDDIWLLNGARMYVDGSLLEYATPECISAHEVTVYELAGQQLVEDTVRKVAKNSSDTYREDGRVFKRSGYAPLKIDGETVSQSITMGHHENYYSSICGTSAQPYTAWDPRLPLLSFLSTRSTWAGAGLVTQDGYEFSQKRNAIDPFASTKTAMEHKKPAFISMPDAPSRLEIRLGDGNMLPAAIHNKFAVTSLVLRLIEHEAFPTELQMTESHIPFAIQRAARNESVLLNTGKVLSPVEHQLRILEAAYTHGEKRADSLSEELGAAEATITALTQILKAGSSLEDIESLGSQIDWVNKLLNLRNHGYTPSAVSFPFIADDLRYEYIHDWNTTYDEELRQEIDVALEVPPATRAMSRTHILANEYEDLPVTAVNWDKVQKGKHYMLLPDPYNASGHYT